MEVERGRGRGGLRQEIVFFVFFFWKAHCINENESLSSCKNSSTRMRRTATKFESGGVGEEAGRSEFGWKRSKSEKEERDEKNRNRKSEFNLFFLFLQPRRKRGEPSFSLYSALFSSSQKALKSHSMVRFVDSDAEERREEREKNAKPILNALFEQTLNSLLFSSSLSIQHSQADARVLQHVLETNKPCQAQVRKWPTSKRGNERERIWRARDKDSLSSTLPTCTIRLPFRSLLLLTTATSSTLSLFLFFSSIRASPTCSRSSASRSRQSSALSTPLPKRARSPAR